MTGIGFPMKIFSCSQTVPVVLILVSGHTLQGNGHAVNGHSPGPGFFRVLLMTLPSWKCSLF